MFSGYEISSGLLCVIMDTLSCCDEVEQDLVEINVRIIQGPGKSRLLAGATDNWLQNGG